VIRSVGVDAEPRRTGLLTSGRKDAREHSRPLESDSLSSSTLPVDAFDSSSKQRVQHSAVAQSSVSILIESVAGSVCGRRHPEILSFNDTQLI